MTEPTKLSKFNMPVLMPKLNPEATAALQNSMLALGAFATQWQQTLKQAAPGIMASVADTLPKLPAHREDRKP
ncbi:MAG TPA: hypothetical protein VFG15_06260 [Amycolatopsis sp.]|nr:hypothetical protein [Amycolatopsis sp.]